MTETKIGMTIEESSEYTGIGRNIMRKLVEWNKLPVLRVGRKVIIRRDILERFMAVNEGRNLRNERDVKAVRN
ncbi:MAG: excisionase family DNA-binding protein [Lachnospiraceae bacterium]|nr:excisionase family DNA-binding protein [Lachnospiraceae bacterium]